MAVVPVVAALSAIDSYSGETSEGVEYNLDFQDGKVRIRFHRRIPQRSLMGAVIDAVSSAVTSVWQWIRGDSSPPPSRPQIIIETYQPDGTYQRLLIDPGMLK